jgi:hypothetical protein
MWRRWEWRRSAVEGRRRGAPPLLTIGKRNGKVIGATAVRGLPQAEDMEVAALGVAAIGG